jgi:hypothetical protein
MRTGEHEMGKPKLFDVMKTLHFRCFKQVDKTSSDLYITMDRVSNDFMSFNHVFSRSETEKELK